MNYNLQRPTTYDRKMLEHGVREAIAYGRENPGRGVKAAWNFLTGYLGLIGDEYTTVAILGLGEKQVEPNL